MWSRTTCSWWETTKEERTGARAPSRSTPACGRRPGGTSGTWGQRRSAYAGSEPTPAGPRQ
eukprot:9470106-Pyramimonas_sp.AAC.1